MGAGSAGRWLVFAVAAGLLAAAGRSGAEEVVPLPALAIDPSGISVSGVSSGGYMAQQFHVAHSAKVMGAAVFAGGPYYCAGDRYPYNLFTALDVCMDFNDFIPFFGPPDSARSIRETRARAEDGSIDDPASMRSDRVYLFSGQADETVPQPVMEALRTYYGAFVNSANIRYVGTVPAGHAMVTSDFGNTCETTAAPYINDCDYDAAGELLTHIYGPLREPTEPTGQLIAFDQSEFVSDPGTASLARVGYLYLPSACADGAKCKLHVAFHGCRQDQAEVGDAFYVHAGYNDWAEANNIIVLYPQAAPRRDRLFGITWWWPNPRGCWDWWGFTGDGFHLKSGAQMIAIEAMIDRLAQPR